jgi:hypothetical protein
MGLSGYASLDRAAEAVLLSERRGMPLTPIPMLLSVAMAAAPLGPGQQSRIAAWLQWAAAYRDCYEPAPFSLRIDERFTASCIEYSLRQTENSGSPEQRAATRALIAATPQLVALLNASVNATGSDKRSAPLDPQPPSPNR